MKVSELDYEQRGKLASLEDPEEILAYVKEEGIELSDEQLDQIAGGEKDWMGRMHCPKCDDVAIVKCVGDWNICCGCGFQWSEPN